MFRFPSELSKDHFTFVHRILNKNKMMSKKHLDGKSEHVRKISNNLLERDLTRKIASYILSIKKRLFFHN